MIVPPLCCPSPIISSFCDLWGALFRSCVGLYTLTSSGQMEVCGHYIHLIPSHLVGEPVPKSSDLIGFFRCLGSTEVVPNQIYSEETSQVYINRETWCKLWNIGQLCRDCAEGGGRMSLSDSVQRLPSNEIQENGFLHWFQRCINARVRFELFRQVNKALIFKSYFRKWCDWQWRGITINLWRESNS